MTIRRLLIANRGEIARRIIRTAHRLGMETVAVFSDADAGALHVREATCAHALGGRAPADSYLRIDSIMDAARAAGADAVHPGYGFLSENPDFAQAVVDASLVWVGPPPAAIRMLGSKSGAKRIADAHGIPCLPGYHGDDQSDARLQAEALRIGFPVMVKAAAGGGGRGMRLVTQAGDLVAAVQTARSEAQSAFGSGELLLERALLAARHVEVQVFADAHGHCIHLGERDCSVQRRHQKLIEESPCPALDAGLRARMGRSAVELVLAAGYAGAGTVEFLVDGDDFYLMEVNARLQVEHAVTEAVTGLDLVEWQLRLAQGEPLPLAQEQVRFEGHAIEVRLCAEDDEFRPHAGVIAQFDAPSDLQFGAHPHSAPALRFDHAMFEGMAVPPYYDSMLGKLISHAATRDQAIDQLAAALGRMRVLGLATNRGLLCACLRHPEFRAGRASIPFLTEHGDSLRAQLRAQEAGPVRRAALAALYPRGSAGSLASPFARPTRIRHRGSVAALDVREADGVQPEPCASVQLGVGRWHVQCGATDLFIDDASFDPPASGPGGASANELRAPFNGRVIAIKVQPGGRVAKGDVLVVLESMKLEHALAAPRDGAVRNIHIEAGQQAATLQLLVTLEAV